MQDKYVGDIGDYGKFAMLRAMEAQGLTLGINWYRTEMENHKDGKCEIPEEYISCDPQLASSLKAIFDNDDSRSVQKLEQAGLLKCEHFIHDLVPGDTSERADWHRRAIERLGCCDLVFLDPDNGLNVKSVKPGSKKSVKYVWINEIEQYLVAGKSVIFYNHRPRKKAEVYFSEYSARLAPFGKPVAVLTFPRKTVRDYFILPATPEHGEKIYAALRSLVTGRFGEKNFCFLQPSLSGR